MSMEPDRLQAVWTTELDRLEVDVVRAERLAETLEGIVPEPWSPPHIPDTMPAEFLERAQALLDRQEAARARLREALDRAQSQLKVATRVHRATGSEGVPVYLDIEA